MKIFHLLLLGLTASVVAWAQPITRRPLQAPNTNPEPVPLTLRAVLKTSQFSNEKAPGLATQAAVESRRLTPRQRADLRALLQLQGRETPQASPQGFSKGVLIDP